MGWDHRCKSTNNQLIAQDIWQVVRHEIWKNQKEKDEWCVDAREPLKVSEEPLPAIKTV